METRLLKEQLKKTEMPIEMKKRIIAKCKKQIETEETIMTKHKSSSFFKNPLAVAASLALCICLTGVTALASTGKLQGFFNDITNWNGAVVGTSYEQSTDEIDISTSTDADQLMIDIRFLLPGEAPYAYLETFGIEHYEIRDAKGKVIEDGCIDMKELNGEAIALTLPTDNLEPGTYGLFIDQLVGGSKADQPLILHGEWACEFTK